MLSRGRDTMRRLLTLSVLGVAMLIATMVASTLAVFVLFSPVRRRIQATVDRRFYRSRYDAAREIDGFAARVLDEVEVDRLAVARARTLERTMQRASASWPRSGGDR